MVTSRVAANKSSLRSFLGRLGWYPTISTRSLTSSATLSYFSCSSSCSRTRWLFCGCFHWNSRIFFCHLLFAIIALNGRNPLWVLPCLWYTRRLSWSFSTSERLVQAPHLFIFFRWKYLLKSWFFFWTTVEKHN